MISFIPEDLTGRLLLFIGIYYLLVILFFWKPNIIDILKPHVPQRLLIFLVLVHLIFAFEGGDYFHYYEDVARNSMDDGRELFYHWLSEAVFHNYILFRIIVWGGALMLFMKTSCRFGFDPYKTVFLLYVMYFTLFDYARASLGMAVFFYGFSFWCLPIAKHELLSYFFVGPLIMLCAPLFHTSMFFLCGLSFVAFIPMNKKIFFVMLALFSVSSTLLASVFNDVLGIILSSHSDMLVAKAENYSEQIADMKEASIFETVRRYVEYSTFFIPALLILRHIFNEKYKGKQHRAMLRLFKVIFSVLMLAVTMLIVTSTIILFYRILFLALIPLTLLFYYSRKTGIVSKFEFNAILVMCLLQVFCNFSKRILGGNIPW